MKMASNVRAITQETFDAAVKENIEDFEMEESEAINDAVDQFKSQGVSLTMIIKDVPTEQGHLIVILIQKLKKLIDNETQDEENVKQILDEMLKIFKKDLAYRYQGSKLEHAQVVLYKACRFYERNPKLLKCCVATFASLLDGQPDLITPEGLQFTLELLENSEDPEMVALLLRVLRLSCTKHEENRIQFVQSNGIENVLSTAEKYKDSESVVKEACGVLRCLTLDDDVRAPYGKAHEHTKLIVTEHSGLERLFKFIEAYDRDTSITKELYSTLGRLLVRNEFCQQMVDLGGLEIISKTIDVHMNQHNVVRQCVTLLKAMSGNDDVKVAVVKAGGAELVLKVLATHKNSPQVCQACFAALTTLSLRNPNHCDVIMANNAAFLMTQAMTLHADHAGVQKQACMAIRNLVARTRYHSKAFIENGAEQLISKARVQHKKVLDDEGKAALRDLDVQVELKEMWKGTNSGVTS